MVNIKALMQALDGGYVARPEEMLRYFLSEIMELWGMKPWNPAPSKLKQQVVDAIGEYDRALSAHPAFYDLLGPLYMELANQGGRAKLGQFFTPWSIAAMMAAMQSPPASSEDERLLTAIDPACGSGVMMLALCSQVLMDHGPAALQSWSVSGIDLDPICSRMMAVQLIANCAHYQLKLGEIAVYEGNALGCPSDLSVVAHATATRETKVLTAEHPIRKQMALDAAKPHFEQLKLFAA